MSTWLTDPRLLQTLYEGSPNGIMLVDWESNVLALNPALARLNKYGDALLGKRILDVAAEQTASFIRDALAAARSGEAIERDVVTPTKDGDPRPVHAASIPVGDGKTGPAIFVVVSDISEHRKTQELLATLFQENPAVVLAIDREERILSINPEGLRVSGFSHDEVVGKPFGAFVPAESLPHVLTAYRNALRGHAVRFSSEAIRRNGPVWHYDGTFIPIRSSNGTVAGAYAILQNVTEREETARRLEARETALEELERDFHSLFDENPNGVIAISADGIIVDVNEAGVRLTGRRRQDVVGRDFRAFLSDSHMEADTAAFQRAIRGTPVSLATTVPHANGSSVDIEAAVLPKYASGAVVGVYVVVTDVTERNALQRQAALRTERLRELYALATSSDNSDANVHAALTTGCKLLGARAGALVADEETVHIEAVYPDRASIDETKCIEYGRAVVEAREAVSTDSWIGTPLVMGSSIYGSLLFCRGESSGRPFDAADMEFLGLLSTLVASALERRKVRSHLRMLAYYDPLTELPNRLLFQERLRDAMLDVAGQERRIAVMLFDLDRFKDMNELLGHTLGDRLLQLVSQRLKEAVGDRGLLARMGGDEFVVMLTGFESVDELPRIAQELLDAIDQPYRIEEYEQFISASLGISVFPEDGRDDQTLIKNADIAMYKAKEHGRKGFVQYSHELEAPLHERLSQEKALRRALARDEFVLHYQPIFDLIENEIVGVEALVRWHHPRRGLSFPDHFIPSAEASGLIVPLGDWILQRSLEQLRRWHESGYRLHLAVNTSARQFFLPDLAERVESSLQRWKIDPAYLHLEITESVAMSDAAQAIDTVKRIKELGACISVDDFGTGHSSLSYLRRFAVDHLKIDRSFVRGIGTEENDETIVKTLIAMGHSLGLVVIAEGVETPEQTAFLRDHGCDRIQGFYISAAVDAPAVVPLVERYRGTEAASG